MSSIDRFLKNNPTIEFFPEVDLSKYSTMKLKGVSNILIFSDIDSLQNAVKYFNQNKMPYSPLGWGANQLLINHAKFYYFKCNFPYNEDVFQNSELEYVLPANLSLAKLTAQASRLGLEGFEVITGIPASLGGALAMNAGTRLGEISELVKSFKVVRASGELIEIQNETGVFSYRKNHALKKGDFIVEATLQAKKINSAIKTVISEYLKKRNQTQPMGESTCGCVFKNPGPQTPVGKLMELVQLKGFLYNNIQVSHKHGNFFINRGGARIEDFEKIIEFITQKFEINFGIQLEKELVFPSHTFTHFECGSSS